jgi:hypothetical protein
LGTVLASFLASFLAAQANITVGAAGGVYRSWHVSLPPAQRTLLSICSTLQANCVASNRRKTTM